MSHRIVHNLTPLNAVTIRDSQEPPLIYLYAEQCAARSIYSGLDLFVGFDTPLGTMRLTVLPQGWTGSVGIFHNDVAFILQHETDKSPNFEVIPENPKIRRFVWEHAVDLNRILHRLVHAGAIMKDKSQMQHQWKRC